MPEVSNPIASTPQPAALGSDERWAAWQAKGVEQDRAFRRKMTIVAPILAVLAAIVYALLNR
jgi:hypothetical protein